MFIFSSPQMIRNTIYSLAPGGERDGVRGLYQPIPNPHRQSPPYSEEPTSCRSHFHPELGIALELLAVNIVRSLTAFAQESLGKHLHILVSYHRVRTEITIAKHLHMRIIKTPDAMKGITSGRQLRKDYITDLQRAVYLRENRKVTTVLKERTHTEATKWYRHIVPFICQCNDFRKELRIVHVFYLFFQQIQIRHLPCPLS